MLRDPRRVRRFEDDQLSASPPDFQAGIRLFEAMWAHARTLGVLPGNDPLAGIEVDIRLARALNV
jgi:hypothetical protein